VGATHPQINDKKGKFTANIWPRWPNRWVVGAHVCFVNRYLSLGELVEHLQACDVYVTPYPERTRF